MKKYVLILIIILIVIASIILWMLSSSGSINLNNTGPFLIVFAIPALALMVGWGKIKSLKRGEPVEDEMSKKILQKASSLSFYISIYAWLVISYLSDEFQAETSTIIGGGIITMAIIFVLSWVFYRIKGIRNE